MRIITLGQVAGIGNGDVHIYEGNAYLLRFSIESPDQFFAIQLPFIVYALGIDIRQIMKLELLGDGDSGLRQATICISFGDPETDDPETEMAFSENAIDKVCAAPSAEYNSFTLCDDELRRRLIRFLLVAPKAARARFLMDFAKTIRHKTAKSKTNRHEPHVAGFLYRVAFDSGSPPDIGEWRDTLLFCSERLRRAFSPERLDRVTFTAIPNSDQSYKVEAEFVLPPTTKIFGVRSELRFRTRAIRPPSSLSVWGLQAGRTEDTLGEAEKIALDKFDELDTKGRLNLWNMHLSKFFK